MIYNIVSIPLAIRLLLFSGLSAVIGLFFSRGNWQIGSVIGICLFISVFELIFYLNGLFRKVTFFFDAVRNEDSTLHFSEKTKDKSFRNLHQSLNRLNDLIGEIKIRNENNERFFRQLLKYSSTGIIVVDESGYIDLINDAALDLLHMENLVHIDLLKQRNNELFENLIPIKPGNGNTIKILDSSGIKLVSVKVAKLKFGNKTYTVYSMYDIKNELEEKELDTWQKLIRVLTHEIMNSVAPITSLSNTLRRIFVIDKQRITSSETQNSNIEKALEGLKVIEETGKGLMNFVDNYRKLTKIPKPVFKPIILEEWLNRVYLLLRDKIEEENIEYTFINHNVRKPFPGDEKLLTQVVINVLNNAIIALDGKEQKKIQITSTYKKNNGLEIKIADNGKGIDEESLDKIFIPFFTTRENGSGIGLSLSRQIMRLHKGNIEAFSKPGQYTTFKLIF